MRTSVHTYSVRGQILSESDDHVEAAQAGASQFETNTAKVKKLIEKLQSVGHIGQCPGDHDRYHPVVPLREEGTTLKQAVPASKFLTMSLLCSRARLVLFPSSCVA